MKKIILIFPFYCLLSFANFALAAGAPNTLGHPFTPSLAPILEKVMPSVVNVKVQGGIERATDSSNDDRDYPDQAENTPSRRFEGLGSGVIVDAAHGYILTNAHVIRRAKTITVSLSDGRNFKATLVGADAPSDVALLQVKATGLTELAWANSDALKVGDFVAAIGNPFGLDQTVTSGIVSAMQRSGLGIEGYESFIQTDASINPGNSGGALINLKGELIGINTAILGPSGGSIGIGFAIPSNMARTVMIQLIKYGSVRRGLMGVSVQDFTPELSTSFHLAANTPGALISMVTPGSPAEKSGFKTGDVIQRINGDPIKNASQVKNVVGLLRVGARISLQILRQGKTMTINLVTQDPQQYQQFSEAKNPFLFGTILKDFDQEVPIHGHVMGVIILRVGVNTAAAHAGLHPGDVIVSANQQVVKTLSQLSAISRQPSKQLLLNVMRQNGALFVVLNR